MNLNEWKLDGPTAWNNLAELQKIYHCVKNYSLHSKAENNNDTTLPKTISVYNLWQYTDHELLAVVQGAGGRSRGNNFAWSTTHCPRAVVPPPSRSHLGTGPTAGINFAPNQASNVRVKELCESRGGRPGLSVLTSLMVSVDVQQHWTVLMHWSQLVTNMSTDIWWHYATQQQQLHKPYKWYSSYTHLKMFKNLKKKKRKKKRGWIETIHDKDFTTNRKITRESYVKMTQNKKKKKARMANSPSGRPTLCRWWLAPCSVFRTGRQWRRQSVLGCWVGAPWSLCWTTRSSPSAWRSSRPAPSVYQLGCSLD